MYGSFFWGMLPMPNKVSWEGHLSGFIAGTIIAYIFRKKGPQPKIYNYEIEEELEENRKKININYIYKKENTSEQRNAVSEGLIGNYNWMHGNPDGKAGIQIRLNEFKRMFESNGIKVHVVIDNSINGQGQVDPPGLDGIPTVRVATDGFADTIPHEFAHIYLDLLGLDNPAVQEALEEIKNNNSGMTIGSISKSFL
jgi:hypothetical protein